MEQVRQREIWVDNVKVIACILVVLGHFFQSMTQANILVAGHIYQWFNQTIYYFHVPLFFICSGYLYQKLSVVHNISNWIKNVLKKLLVLGVPYFTFSFVTWILKIIFASAVNNKIGGLKDVLFLHPTSPYWYLYALFFLFLITPTFHTKRMATGGLIIALIFKAFELFIQLKYVLPVISYVCSNEIWFVIGMCLSVFEFKKYLTKKGEIIAVMLGTLFLIFSIYVYMLNIENEIIDFLLGFVACCSVIIVIRAFYQNREQSKFFGFLAKYTMPIFLMHTLFAAPLRVVLFKVGVENAVIHVSLGIMISFLGPIVAAIVMEKMKWPEFFLYPGKFIKIK